MRIISRVDRMPTAIPTGITITVAPENIVTVKGPKGELVKAMYKDIDIAVENTQVVIARPNDVKEHRVLHGLARALLNNMVVGISQSLSKTLELNGVGYKAQLQGKKLIVNLGYSHLIEIEVADGVDFRLDGTIKAIVEGIDKEKAGAVTANTRSWRKPESYEGKGTKYFDGVIRRREGKTGK